MAQVFLYIQYTISFGFLPKLSASLTAWTVPFRIGLPTLSKTIKKQAKCSIFRPLPFSLSLILNPPADLQPPDALLRALPAGGVRSRYALRCESGTGPSSVPGLTCLAKMSPRVFGSSSPLVSAVSLASSKSYLAVTACNNSRLSRCSARPQTRQSFSWLPQLRIASLRQYVPPDSLDSASGACFSYPVIHHRPVIAWDFPQYLHIIADALALARAAIPLASSSACSVIALLPLALSSRSFSASLRAC